MCIEGKFLKQTKGVVYKAWRYWGLNKKLQLTAAHSNARKNVWTGIQRSTNVVSKITDGNYGLHSVVRAPSRRRCAYVYGRIRVAGVVSIFCRTTYRPCPTCGAQEKVVNPRKRTGYLSSKQQIVSLVVPKRLLAIKKAGHYRGNGWVPPTYFNRKEIATALRKRYKVPVKVL